DDELEDGDEDGDDVAADPAAALAPDVRDSDHEWSRRKLCPDGACVGVVGASGACTVCGKTFA
ncbi:MAG: hypothetical protein ABI678_17710, partial [Kofleriaceae bacterium]